MTEVLVDLDARRRGERRSAAMRNVEKYFLKAGEKKALEKGGLCDPISMIRVSTRRREVGSSRLLRPQRCLLRG